MGNSSSQRESKLNAVNKILYSLFTFFVCGFAYKSANADVACGRIVYTNNVISNAGGQGNSPMFCCNTAMGTSGICNEISFDSRYSAVCVEFSGVRFLGLYNCRAISYGCAEMEHKYTSSGCVACPKGELARNKVLETSSSIHDFQIAKTCGYCDKGYYATSASASCTKCPSQYGSTGTTISITSKSSAPQSKCYITSGSGSDTTGSFTIAGQCFYSNS